MSDATFFLDGVPVPFTPGQTVLQAALAAGHNIPHLCHHPEFKPHGSCKVCTVRANGRMATGCTLAAQTGWVVESETDELRTLRQSLVQMLFAEGNHFCPSCEQSGDCQLQSLGYALGVLGAGYRHFFPDRPVDASHPDLLIDFNRCILCELCVRASAEVDGKAVFALGGRGLDKHLIINAASGRLADTNAARDDKAMSVCPVGAILKKRVGFAASSLAPIPPPSPALPRTPPPLAGEGLGPSSAGLMQSSPPPQAGEGPGERAVLQACPDQRAGPPLPRKLRVATTSLAGCFGCHMSLLDIDERLFALLELVEFDRTPLTDIKDCGPCDIGLIEGGVCNAENVHVLQAFRRQCRVLVALGACAVTGGLPAQRNHLDIGACLTEVYLTEPGLGRAMIPNDPELPLPLDKVHPIHEVVKVDYLLPGCPPSADAIWRVLTDLIAGREPVLGPELIRYD